MENEPVPPPSSVPPPPNIPPPPPPPDMPPPPPPVAVSPVSAPPVDPYVAPKQDPSISMDGEVPAIGGKDAQFGNRVIAAFIDSVAAGIVINILAALKMGPVGWLLYIGFFLVRDALPFLDGQSPGKKLMNLRAVDAAGNKLTNNWQTSITRNIMMVIPVGSLVELIVMFTRKDSGGPLRRLGDDWAKTRVIEVPQDHAGSLKPLHLTASVFPSRGE